MAAQDSWGKALAAQLRAHLAVFQRGPIAADHQRTIIWGVTNNGVLVGGMTLDLFLARTGQILCESGQVYRWENMLVYEFREPDNPELVLLSVKGNAEKNATSLLTNLVGVGVQGEESTSQSLVPSKLVHALLADEMLARRLPAIKTYARRPVYDDSYTLRGPGWYAEAGILIHGPDIMPAVLTPTTSGPSIDRLPPYLKRLLQDFCWASEADMENTLGLSATKSWRRNSISAGNRKNLDC
jgi:hypothetical protein